MIDSLEQLACTHCEYAAECLERCKRVDSYMNICDTVIRNVWPKEKCPIWIAIRVDKKGSLH